MRIMFRSISEKQKIVSMKNESCRCSMSRFKAIFREKESLIERIDSLLHCTNIEDKRLPWYKNL